MISLWNMTVKWLLSIFYTQQILILNDLVSLLKWQPPSTCTLNLATIL